jgi:hypothetical protein
VIQDEGDLVQTKGIRGVFGAGKKTSINAK